MTSPLSAKFTLVDREQYELLLLEASSGVELFAGNDQRVLIVDGHFAGKDELTGVLLAAVDDGGTLSDPLSQYVWRFDGALRTFGAPAVEFESLWPTIEGDPRSKTFSTTLRLLLEIYSFLEQSYMSCAVVMTTLNPVRRKHWWMEKTDISTVLDRWRDRVKFEIGEGRPLDSVGKKLDQIADALRVLEKHQAKGIEEVLATASALCMVCAEVLLKRGSAALALMLINRSTEYLLSAIALDAGLARETASGVIMASDSKSAGTKSLIDCLTEKGRVSARFKDPHVFLRVNAARNRLSFTHGFSAVTVKEVQDALVELRDELKNLDPTLGWWSKVRDLRPQWKNSSDVLRESLEFGRWVVERDRKQVRLDAGLDP